MSERLCAELWTNSKTIKTSGFYDNADLRLDVSSLTEIQDLELNRAKREHIPMKV